MPESILEVAVDYLQKEVAPKAQEIDRDPAALRKALQGLCDLNLMALKCPKEYGGPGISEEDFRRFQEECSRASGALAFLQTQHQSATGLIAKSKNEALKAEYLPRMGNGEKLVGIGFSQLRRGGPPIMRAEETQGGYVLNGHVPWVTGWDYYPEFVVGATLPDGQALFAIAPLQEGMSGETAVGRIRQTEPTSIRISPIMRLAAMETPNTVTVDFEDFFVPNERVVFIQAATWIKNNDQINIALQGHFALGCAQAGLDILRTNADKKALPFLTEAHNALASELKECREETKKAQAQANEETTQERLNVRAWAIDLAVRCAHAAVTSSSGAANSINHPAQRVYREALVFTVSAQTTEIMEATLRRITHSPERFGS
jgi:alkylation response protein AidB-like acyl-CoA dehydrogenase